MLQLKALVLAKEMETVSALSVRIAIQAFLQLAKQVLLPDSVDVLQSLMMTILEMEALLARVVS